MADDPSRLDDLHTLRNLIEEASLNIPADLPQGRGKRASEILASALALCEDLIAEPGFASSAAAIGKRGGSKTAERGSDYFRQLAAKRKTRSGGKSNKN